MDEPGRKCSIQPVSASQTELTPEERQELLSGVVDAHSSDYNDERMGYGNFYVGPLGVLHVEFEHDETHAEHPGEKWVGRWELTYLGSEVTRRGAGAS